MPKTKKVKLTRKEEKELKFNLAIVERMVRDYVRLGVPFKTALKQTCKLLHYRD